jgi:chromosome segregation ATPase
MDLLIFLTPVGTGIAVLLVLLEAVKLYLHKARLVKKINTFQSQLEVYLLDIKFLNDEKNSIEKKTISLQEKFCEVETCNKELRSKIQRFDVHKESVCDKIYTKRREVHNKESISRKIFGAV